MIWISGQMLTICWTTCTSKTTDIFRTDMIPMGILTMVTGYELSPWVLVVFSLFFGDFDV
jgi:hypothetical protein